MTLEALMNEAVMVHITVAMLIPCYKESMYVVEWDGIAYLATLCISKSTWWIAQVGEKKYPSMEGLGHFEDRLIDGAFCITSVAWIPASLLMISPA